MELGGTDSTVLPSLMQNYVALHPEHLDDFHPYIFRNSLVVTPLKHRDYCMQQTSRWEIPRAEWYRTRIPGCLFLPP